LEYIDKQIEIEANEREAREKLNAVRKQVCRIFPLFLFNLNLLD